MGKTNKTVTATVFSKFHLLNSISPNLTRGCMCMEDMTPNNSLGIVPPPSIQGLEVTGL